MNSNLNLNTQDNEYEAFLRKIGIVPTVLPKRHPIGSNCETNTELPNEIDKYDG